MACFHPLLAWRTRSGEVVLWKEQKDATALRLPCGGCLGCRKARAREWALRCHLEAQQHQHTSFTTLTYDEVHLPITLTRRHLQLFLKRLRSATAQPFRFFASGEYGEKSARPHYHALLFGIPHTHAATVEACWAMGNTRTEVATPARIAYCAGYAAKKIGFKLKPKEEVDPHTGEVYTWQPPFIQMSRGGRRGHGIGGHARQYTNSWRNYAVLNGQIMPVPRYLHQAWKDAASLEDQEQLLYEKSQLALTRYENATEERLRAAEQIEIQKQSEAARKRQLN